MHLSSSEVMLWPLLPPYCHSLVSPRTAPPPRPPSTSTMEPSEESRSVLEPSLSQAAQLIEDSCPAEKKQALAGAVLGETRLWQ